MTNENQLPIFSGGLQPIGKMHNAHPLPVATKKQSSTFMKRLLAHAKPAPKAKAKGRASTGGKTRGIASSNKIKFGSYPKYY